MKWDIFVTKTLHQDIRESIRSFDEIDATATIFG